MFSAMLREWRGLRGMSQLDLALSAEVSTRHISFIESERSKPSADMVLRLAEALNLPLRERNGLLVAAGYAPQFGESDWWSDAMADVRRATALLLAAHEPHPAIVLDAAFNILDANPGARGMIGISPDGPGTLNLVDLVYRPGPVRDSIVNWVDVAEYLLHRMREGVRRHGPQSAMGAVMRRAMVQPGAALLSTVRGPGRGAVLLPLEIKVDGQITRWFTTVTSFGAPQDALVEEITIEQFHPA
ncbi:helix-turn-helix transcriptional regulator [Devosia sp.]|uniref:helix-turn-helix transcriptional regulator n=1 Tax=Devosia sp. TaxID=1871048 RepID=UPI002FC7C91E